MTETPEGYGPPGSYRPAPAVPPVPYYPPAPYNQAGQAVSPYYPAAYPAPVPGSPGYLPPFPLVSAGGRIGAYLLDFLLIVVTLGLGWLIWACITWANGQTPAKSLLGHVVVDANTGLPFGWGQMFLREFVIRGLLLTVLNTFTFGILGIVDCFSLFRAGQRTLHDQMAGSLVRPI